MDQVLWAAWGLMMVGFVIQAVATLVGTPRRVAASGVMVGAAGLMLVGFVGSLSVSIVGDDRGGTIRWGSALAAFVVVVLLTRRGHVRAQRPQP